jgi:Flp pilus assembly protein TadG
VKRRLLGRLVRDESGAAALEFAIVGNVFLLLLMGISYTAIMLWHKSHLNWAVDAASRLAAVNTSVTQADMTTAVNNYLTSVGLDTASVTYSVQTLSGVKVGLINATMTETLRVPLLNTFHLTYQASARVPQP